MHLGPGAAAAAVLPAQANLNNVVAERAGATVPPVQVDPSNVAQGASATPMKRRVRRHIKRSRKEATPGTKKVDNAILQDMTATSPRVINDIIQDGEDDQEPSQDVLDFAREFKKEQMNL